MYRYTCARTTGYIYTTGPLYCGIWLQQRIAVCCSSVCCSSVRRSSGVYLACGPVALCCRGSHEQISARYEIDIHMHTSTHTHTIYVHLYTLRYRRRDSQMPVCYEVDLMQSLTFRPFVSREMPS